MSRYAANTEVTSDRSRAEIERTLMRYGATHFGYMTEPGRVVIGFRASGRSVKFVLPMPDLSDPEFQRTPARRTKRSPAAAEAEWEKACRQRWRALALCVKAKLEAVEAGIATFDEEFLAYLALPDGTTVAERALPQIAVAYETGKTPPLLGYES